LSQSDCLSELFYTEDEVLELLLALDTSTTNGPENITAKMFNYTAVSVALYLLLLLTSSKVLGT